MFTGILLAEVGNAMGSVENYILWSGAPFERETFLRFRAVPVGGNYWIEGMVRGLLDIGTHVRVIGHLPEPLFPRGRLVIGPGLGRLAEGVQGELVNHYMNLPGIRPHHLAWNYRRKLREIVCRHGKPRAVITYNADAVNCALGVESQSHGIPWVSLVADMTDPGPSWSRFPASAAKADAHVFLSWHAFCSFPFSDIKLHLDAGVQGTYRDSPQPSVGDSCGKKIILFAGSFSRWAGLAWLLEAFSKLRDQHLELWVCGKGDTGELEKAMASDARVKYLGLKTRDELHDIYLRADVITNPRPYSLPENAHNFPCKLLDSLAYCRPVVSTLTAGVSPEYRELVVPVEDETASALAAALDEAVRMSLDAREALATRIAAFLSSGRTWRRQSERLVVWLDQVLLPYGK